MIAAIEFGQRVADARRGLGLSVTEAAEQTGVDESEWDVLEVDAAFVSTEMGLGIMRFLVAAGVSARWLITGEGDMGGQA